MLGFLLFASYLLVWASGGATLLSHSTETDEPSDAAAVGIPFPTVTTATTAVAPFPRAELSSPEPTRLLNSAGKSLRYRNVSRANAPLSMASIDKPFCAKKREVPPGAVRGDRLGKLPNPRIFLTRRGPSPTTRFRSLLKRMPAHG